VHISLWGLQFRFPEHDLAADVVEGIRIVRSVRRQLRQYAAQAHSKILGDRDDIRGLLRQNGFAARSTLLSCFNLVEAYLNGLAWEYLQAHGTASLSNRQRKLLDDSSSTTIRDKLLKYPEIVCSRGTPWHAADEDEDVKSFLDVMKPFRDSLVHPSPFSAPAKFGGHDKLRLVYRIDCDTAEMAAAVTARLLTRIHTHLDGTESPRPAWMVSLTLPEQGNAE